MYIQESLENKYSKNVVAQAYKFVESLKNKSVFNFKGGKLWKRKKHGSKLNLQS